MRENVPQILGSDPLIFNNHDPSEAPSFIIGEDLSARFTGSGG
jgi:hypothetical protein